MEPQIELTASPDCRTCGVCCFSGSPTYVPVTGDDWLRLGRGAEMYAHFIGNRAFMRMKEGHCAALEMRRGEAGNAEFLCSVYGSRPQVCRELERGSPACEGERARKLMQVQTFVATLDCPRRPAM